MDIKPIIIESDVVENIFRPISLFLNDVPTGTTLQFLSVRSVDSRIPDSEQQVHHYKFLADNGTIYSFTQYDLSHFTINGKKLSEVLHVQQGKDAKLSLSFKVIGMTQRKTVAGQIQYPPFAYEGYDSFSSQLAAGGDRTKLRTALYQTKVVDDHKDRYYRIVDIDKDIVYYED